MAFADLLLGTFSVPFYINFVGDALCQFGQENTAFISWHSDASMPFLCSAHIYLELLYLVRNFMLYISRLKNDYCPPKHIIK